MKKNFLDFCTQVLVAFAYTILLLNVFCLLFGNDVKEMSSIFALGELGLSVSTVFQFLGVSVLIVGIRTFFVADPIIKKLPYWLRNLGMLVLIPLVIIAFVFLFSWFPAENPRAWVLFLICYGASFTLSTVISTIRIKSENKRLQAALDQLKSRQEAQ